MHLILLWIAYVDMKEKRIPDELNWLLLLIFLLEDPRAIVAALVVFFTLTPLYLFNQKVLGQEPLGFGDIKLFAVLAAGLKNSQLSFIVSSFFLAGLFGIFSLLSGKGAKESFPLAPFMILAFLFYK